ncbi:MAG: UDP-N-acetylglucosamine 1-carboxyvinyltransferase [Actinobacteria bacterium QS_5_72_10]|jgi:UDP-N-acetylglucosamine 1-carboxyvinyltransferase|nr:MAG: UDP-N-acetylglucosamine 1-carboxyvinyltransferase [Actinobacteria bacterium QS_5_72_10]
MDAFEVLSGGTLSGAVCASGAKNSALKLLAASLLAEGCTTIRNVPAIADLDAMGRVLAHLGVDVARDGDVVSCDVPAEIGCDTPASLVTRLRASIVVLGPLVSRCGHARVAQPGGCNLGNRGIDLHLWGLAQLGAEITLEDEAVVARAPQGGRLRGTELELPYASVGATENLLMAAVTATGTTRILNPAREPEIVDLAGMLSQMGARVAGAGSDEIVIDGVDALEPVDHTVVGDRIEAGTYAVAGALAGGEITVEGVEPAHLALVLDKLADAGAAVTLGDRSVTVAGAPLRAVDVVTLPFPGFPTDLQAAFLVLLSQAQGTSMLTENVFDGRFRVVDQLVAMGADVSVEAHHAIVRGPCRLEGARVAAPDLRAGAALVLAGLVADGPTVVTQAHHIERGYADLPGKLAALGAGVRRLGAVEAPPAPTGV